MKIVSAIITFILLAASGVLSFFLLLLGLNGFSESDAAPAIYLFIGIAVFSTIVLSIGSYFLTNYLIKKSFNAILAVIISIVAAVAVGLLVDFGAVFGSAILASEIRQSHTKKPGSIK